MKKRYVLLLLAVLLLAISAVSAADDSSLSNETLEVDNVDEMPLKEEVSDDNQEKFQSTANSTDASSNDAADDDKVVQVPSKAQTKNIKSTYGTQAKYTLKLTDQSGNIIVGKNVTFKVNGKTYKIKTNKNATK